MAVHMSKIKTINLCLTRFKKINAGATLLAIALLSGCATNAGNEFCLLYDFSVSNHPVNDCTYICNCATKKEIENQYMATENEVKDKCGCD